MIKEKYPGAVSSQPTKKTSNGNTGKKSGKGKGETNMKTKYEKGSVRNKNKTSYGKYKRSVSSVKTMQKKEHMLRCNQNEQMQKPLYLWIKSCKRLLDAVCPVSIRP